MRSTTWLPILGVGILIGALCCAPREEAGESEPDAAGGAVDPAEAVPDAAAVADAAANASPPRATAALIGAPDSGVSGSVEITDEGGMSKVTIHVTGARVTGPLGIHVHEAGICTPPDFESAGEHFNPTAAPHACAPTTPRHAGDFGNIEIAQGGEGHLEFETDLLTVAEGPSSVVGRAIVLHDGKDDCVTLPGGNSGNRLACGVFELATD